MTTTIQKKTFGQAAPAANTPTDLYTCPAGGESVSASLYICNRGSSEFRFRVSLSVGGGATANKDYLFYDVIGPANDTFIATTGIILAAGDVLRVSSDSANISYTLQGEEQVTT